MHATSPEPREAPLRRHFRRPAEPPFAARERGRVTLLFGGLTVRHDQLMAAGLEGLGYRAQPIPVPDKADFQTGREYGNNGQCNPTYFTVGALVSYLKRLRDQEGVSTERILADYVFVTAGSCGPCRFGMYEAEYRLALRNAGFDGFRVLVFSQEGGLSQSAAAEAGLALTPLFFVTLVNAVMVGDSITLDAEQRLLQLNVPDEEIARRSKAWHPPAPRYTRAVLAKYARQVPSASKGAVTD